jgi:Ca2+-binding RTX toxin-like protein
VLTPFNDKVLSVERVLSYDTATEIQCGAGNDVYFSETDLDESPAPRTTLSLGPGDDRADIAGYTSVPSLIDVFGDAGNDRIISGSPGRTVHGGEGNDTLSAGGGLNHSSGLRFYGDAGDDWINIDNGVLFGTADFASGGDGNDTVTASRILRDNIYGVYYLDFDDVDLDTSENVSWADHRSTGV